MIWSLQTCTATSRTPSVLPVAVEWSSQLIFARLSRVQSQVTHPFRACHSYTVHPTTLAIPHKPFISTSMYVYYILIYTCVFKYDSKSTTRQNCVYTLIHFSHHWESRALQFLVCRILPLHRQLLVFSQIHCPLQVLF